MFESFRFMFSSFSLQTWGLWIYTFEKWNLRLASNHLTAAPDTLKASNEHYEVHDKIVGGSKTVAGSRCNTPSQVIHSLSSFHIHTLLQAFRKCAAWWDSVRSHGVWLWGLNKIGPQKFDVSKFSLWYRCWYIYTSCCHHNYISLYYKISKKYTYFNY